ncbi:broad specificity phosphatase PhoE [Neobacillus niacini]|nr:broad specificity phosphatase PhoE [Neobacillus niacini]
MITLYITRHGETEWNIEKRMQGWLDSNLTENGIKNAVC